MEMEIAVQTSDWRWPLRYAPAKKRLEVFF